MVAMFMTAVSQSNVSYEIHNHLHALKCMLKSTCISQTMHYSLPANEKLVISSSTVGMTVILV
jgi:hypothetical protein